MGIGVLGDFISSGTARRRWSTGGAGSSWAGLLGLIWRPLTVALFLILLAGLLRVQIFQGAYFRGLADGNRIARVVIHAPRGVIYDRNKVPLVVNLPSYRLKTCLPASGPERLADGCETRLVSKTQAIEMEVKGLTAGQSLELDSTRNYPHGAATAHLLGYVSEISPEELTSHRDYLAGDVVGRGGLEQQYETLLRGKNGEEVVEVDALGNRLRVLAVTPPVAGQDVNTSIDISVQKTAYEQIKDKVGAVVATDPAFGSVIALVSSPSFDPNVFTDLSLPSDYRTLKIKGILSDGSRPLFNRAISGTYPAGSTFKIVTATAGLESGKITENTTIDDPGVLIIGPYKFPNWLYMRNGGTQGVVNVVTAIAKSNDIFFYRVGEWVGLDELSRWALKFGLSSRLGIDLPNESSGSFPTPEWRDRFAPNWYLGDTYHLAIGQGDLLVTPLQVNGWTSVIANGGGVCTPKVIQDTRYPSSGFRVNEIQDTGRGNGCKDVGISKETLKLVKQGMIAACSPGGTAWPLFNFKNQKSNIKNAQETIQIACKTGTAEFGDPKNRTHAWLTAFVVSDEALANLGSGLIAVTVLVEGGGEGSDVAAPITKKILETYFAR